MGVVDVLACVMGVVEAVVVATVVGMMTGAGALYDPPPPPEAGA